MIDYVLGWVAGMTLFIPLAGLFFAMYDAIYLPDE